MNKVENQRRFEALLESTHRQGMEKLIAWVQKSDLYTAPASTKFHLSCEGGLLQHSLNVYDALCGGLEKVNDEEYSYKVAGEEVARFKSDTLIIAALLHDLCKVGFYTTEFRNQKVYKPNGNKRDNGGRFDWEQVPVYAIDDKNPYGHGEKSVLIAMSFIRLTSEEVYAIRWHMGMANETYNNIQSFNASVDKYPLVLLLHNADQEASHFMEDASGNKELFEYADQNAAAYADNPATDDAEPMFMDAATV